VVFREALEVALSGQTDGQRTNFGFGMQINFHSKIEGCVCSHQILARRNNKMDRLFYVAIEGTIRSEEGKSKWSK
jgi:hypothetical protein